MTLSRCTGRPATWPLWLLLGRSSFDTHHLYTTLRFSWYVGGVNLLLAAVERGPIRTEDWSLLLNGLGLVMIHRVDIAKGRETKAVWDARIDAVERLLADHLARKAVVGGAIGDMLDFHLP